MTGWKFADRIFAWVAAYPEKFFLACFALYLLTAFAGF